MISDALHRPAQEPCFPSSEEVFPRQRLSFERKVSLWAPKKAEAGGEEDLGGSNPLVGVVFYII